MFRYVLYLKCFEIKVSLFNSSEVGNESCSGIVVAERKKREDSSRNLSLEKEQDRKREKEGISNNSQATPYCGHLILRVTRGKTHLCIFLRDAKRT